MILLLLLFVKTRVPRSLAIGCKGPKYPTLLKSIVLESAITIIISKDKKI